MGIKIKNLQTGEFEKFNIPALKGEKGEPGEIEPSEKVDYIGKQHSKLRDTMNANVDYIIKTAIGEFNYLDYEGQHITATNSIEGHAKSAILKGQTLVNLVGEKREYSDMGLYGWEFMLPYKLTKDARYMVVFNASGTITDNSKVYLMDNGFGNNSGNSPHPVSFTLGYNKHITTASGDNHKVLRIRTGSQAVNNLKVSDVMLIPYQEGMENWDIPYFEGMQSVKIPVLTTSIGQLNLILNLEVGGLSSVNGSLVNDSTRIRSNLFELNDSLFICSEINKNIITYFYDSSESYLSNIAIASKQSSVQVSIPNEAKYGRIVVVGESNPAFKVVATNKQTTFNDFINTPFKSNILTVNEPVELRGIGNVQDKLDLLSGKMTERIGEIVLDGSENWTKIAYGHNENYLRFDCSDKKARGISQKLLISDKFITYYGSECEGKTSYIAGHTSLEKIVVVIEKSKLSTHNATGFKEWVSQNPITVQYQLATPTIKTVDLSDNVVYSYKDTTHYTCSSAEGSLVPTLSVKVPTDTQLTIQEQKVTTQTLLIKNMDLQQSIKEVQAMNLAFNTALYNSFNSIREEVEDIKKHVSTNENLEGSF